jgi:DNA ligase OB-like domain
MSFTPYQFPLAVEFNAFRLTYPCFVQRKFNGIRMAIHPDGTLESRHGKIWNKGILPHIENLALGSATVLDGELWHPSDSIQRTVELGSIIRVTPHSNVNELGFVDFKRAIYWQCNNIKEIQDKQFHATAANWEGLVIYQQPPDRAKFPFMMKWKPLKYSTYVQPNILQFIEGRGKWKGTLGAMVLAFNNFGRTFKVSGSNLSDKWRQIIFELQPKDIESVEIKFPETSGEGIPLKAQIHKITYKGCTHEF